MFYGCYRGGAVEVKRYGRSILYYRCSRRYVDGVVLLGNSLVKSMGRRV